MMSRSESSRAIATSPVATAPPNEVRLRLRLGEAPTITTSSRILFAFIATVFIATRVWNLTAYGLFSDEVFSAQTASLNWTEMLRAVVQDVVHPPLFYILLKAWIALGGNGLVWMKWFPVAMAIASLIPFYWLCRELHLRPATMNLALGFIAVNEYLVNYAQELRMYSLVFGLTCASMGIFARVVNATENVWRPQLALFAVNLLLVYTHYYGWLIVGPELLFLLAANRRRALWFAVSFALLVACFLPWAFVVTEAAIDKGGLGPNLNWNPRPALMDMLWHYVILNGPVYGRWKAIATIFSTLLFFAPVLIWLRRVIKNREANERAVFAWLALLAFLPTITAFAASYALSQSIWGTRFLIIVAPPYLLLLALAAMQLEPHWLRRLVVMLMIAWVALSGGMQLSHRDKIAWEPLVHQMIQAEAGTAEITKVYTKQGVVGVTTQYYLDRAQEKQLHIEYVDDYDDPQDEHFWIAVLRYKHEHQPLPQVSLRVRGLVVGDVIAAYAPGHSVLLIPVWRQRPPR
jgi:hypothetical protein